MLPKRVSRHTHDTYFSLQQNSVVRQPQWIPATAALHAEACTANESGRRAKFLSRSRDGQGLLVLSRLVGTQPVRCRRRAALPAREQRASAGETHPAFRKSFSVFRPMGESTA